MERCLQDGWKVPGVVQDGDGDYPFRFGTAACYVSITVGEVPTFARVWAMAAVKVKKSAKLLAELNEINARTLTARIYWANGSVVVEQMADNYGGLIAAGFAGHTPFDAVDELDEAATES